METGKFKTIGKQVSFAEPARHVHAFALFNLLTYTLMYDLHIHARTLKEHIFVLSRVGRLTVCHKFVFANNFDVLLRDVIVDGVSFRFHLVGIGFVSATRLPRECTCQEEKRKEQFLHSSFKFYMMRLRTAITAFCPSKNMG